MSTRYQALFEALEVHQETKQKLLAPWNLHILGETTKQMITIVSELYKKNRARKGDRECVYMSVCVEILERIIRKGLTEETFE